MNLLSKEVQQHNGQDCFNDKAESDALRKFALEDKLFQKFIIEWVSLS